MKHATATLSGALLDQAVAMATEVWKTAHEMFPAMTLDPTFKGCRLVEYQDGRKACFLEPRNPMRQDPQEFRPSTDWAHGGPLCEEHRIDLSAPGWAGGEVWCASIGEGSSYVLRQGATPLIAAMRCIVASKLGDEVEL